jgi:hypothetical protein
MKNAPGYPLPDGELGEDEIVCQLVYLPDRPEYWQAFLGALHYMTTWRAWQRDADKRGQDAAANWRAAFELTIGCWRMTCLQELQDDVAEILEIMRLGQSCCDEQDITDGDQYTDRIEDGVGDVPQNVIDAGYAEDAADWDGFDDYKCMICHVTVDQLDAKLLEFAPIVNSYGAAAGGLAAVAAILAVILGTGGLAIVFGMVAGVGAVSLLYESLMEGDLLEILAAKVVTNHDELACAMYDSDGDVGALVALNDKIDELFTVPEALILKNLNLGPTIKALYSGRYDQQDIADILLDAGYELGDFDCSCVPIPVGDVFGIEWTFGTIWGTGAPRAFYHMKNTDEGYFFQGDDHNVDGETTDSIQAISVGAGQAGIKPGANWLYEGIANWAIGSDNQINFGITNGPATYLWEIDEIRVFLSDDEGITGIWHTANISNLSGTGTAYATLDDQVTPNTLVLTRGSSQGTSRLDMTLTAI